MRIDCKTYLEVDEIDHLTIKYRRGQGLDRKAAAEKIQYHAACSEDVNRALAGADVTRAALNAYTDDELYGMLVKIRTVLLDAVL